MISAMSEELIKESLSKDFLGVIASRNGYKKIQPFTDNGVDLSVTYPTSYIHKGHKRIIDSGKVLEIQLKATTESQIIVKSGRFQYDLEVKNYNDLIFRRDNYSVPLILVIFILPDDHNLWTNIDIEYLMMRKNAFWFYPEDNERASTNKTTQRIFISTNNRITINFFDQMIEHFY